MAMTPLHITVGMSIGALVGVPWVSIPLAFASHAILDLYPEWGNSDHKVDRVDAQAVVIEGLLGLATVGALVLLGRWELWACAVAANLIDLCDFILKKVIGRKVWFCHGGSFPFGKVDWPHQEMRPMQTAIIDLWLIMLMLGLIFMCTF